MYVYFCWDFFKKGKNYILQIMFLFTIKKEKLSKTFYIFVYDFRKGNVLSNKLLQLSSV